MNFQSRQRAGAEAAYGGGHAFAAIAVEAGLRAVFQRGPLHRLLGRGGQVEAGERGELRPGSEDLLAGGGLDELDADGFGVAVFDGDAVAVGADAGVQGLDLAAGQFAEELEGFLLQSSLLRS